MSVEPKLKAGRAAGATAVRRKGAATPRSVLENIVCDEGRAIGKWVRSSALK